MRILTLLVLGLIMAPSAFASHWLAGEFRYVHLTGNTYSIKFRSHTDLSSPADRPELIFVFGDGTHDTVPRNFLLDDPSGGTCANGLRFSAYEIDHTFPGPGTYVITLEDPNRNGGIINIQNSIGQSFCVSATLVIDPSLGPNNSVRFENPPTIWYQNGWTIEHPLDPIDLDGDSLSFEDVTPMGLDCQPIPWFQLPDPSFTVDPAIGHVQWTATALGEYVVAIKANEWRNGQMIGQVIRDMTVCVTLMVGMDDLEVPTFTISPTLTDGPIRISTALTRPTAFQIFDSSGRIHMQGTLQPGDQVIDLGNASAGVYHVRVNNEAVRVVKQ